MEFSDDEDDGGTMHVEWALVGKVLSPGTLHVSTIGSAMKPAWGNPVGLKFRSIGEKSANLFVAEFGCMQDRDRALAGSPWVVGKYSVLLQLYNARLSTAEISFNSMEIWARILNLPLGWMNRKRGTRAMSLLGRVVLMDVDKDDKASGAFLRARISIDLSKPIRRGVLLQMSRTDEPRWFDVQYEKLPFFCFSCGIIGHSELECPSPAMRNERGKLPYQTEVPLRAPDDRRRKMQSFAAVAAETYHTGPSRTKPRSTPGTQAERQNASHGTNLEPERSTGDTTRQSKADGTQVPPPNRTTTMRTVYRVVECTNAGSMELDNTLARKRKSERQGDKSLDLNLPAHDNNQMVQLGTVSDRITQLGQVSAQTVSDPEALKKQKLSTTKIARSAAAADGSSRRAQ